MIKLTVEEQEIIVIALQEFRDLLVKTGDSPRNIEEVKKLLRKIRYE